MFEHRSHPLIPRQAFLRRTAKFVGLSAALILCSLWMGAAGYHFFEGQRWLDAVYSASMILTGMGPATDVKTDAGKIFVTFYALYSALVFLTAGAIILTPVAHRALHRFHLEMWHDDEGEARSGLPGAPRTRKPGQSASSRPSNPDA